MDANAWAIIGAAGIAGTFSFIIAIKGKTHDARVLAEAALLAMPAPIIAEQNKRIADMQEDQNKLWTQLQDMYKREQQCQDDLREYRHQNRDLMMKVTILESKIENLERKYNGEIC